MRVFIAAFLAFLAAPTSALVASPRISTVELAATTRTSAPFELVGLHWQGAGTVAFRTRSVGGRWSRWRPAAPEAEDLPDSGSGRWRIGNPYWVGRSDAIQYRTFGRVERVRAHFVRSRAVGVPPRTTSAAGSPTIISRTAWRANERMRRGRPQYAEVVRFAVVHHTAGSNRYTRAQSPAIVRAITAYHVRGNGWNDVGYNFLVDKYGQVFEGRYGGIDKNVVGAHAQGFNIGSVGVALIGNYNAATVTPAARAAITRLLAWRLDVAHVDPISYLVWPSGGNPRFPRGFSVFLPAISGHRDTGFTSCPGAKLHSQLGSIANRVAALGLPKLYEPDVQGSVGGLVRFTARLSSPRPWTVTVKDGTGAQVAAGSGVGTAIDWTWDATSAQPARYAYAIEAGAAVTAATGIVRGSTAKRLTLTGVRVTPSTLASNGEAAVVSYALNLPATVTATLEDAQRRAVATLFSGTLSAGPHSFGFTAQGLPGGNYTVAIRARAADATEAQARVPVTVVRRS